MSDSVCAADDWKVAGAGVVRTVGQLLVYGFQGCGVNVHDHFAVTCHWLVKLLAPGRLSELVQNGGIHDGFALSYILSPRQ